METPQYLFGVFNLVKSTYNGNPLYFSFFAFINKFLSRGVFAILSLDKNVRQAI